jgi:hypothetical protein
VEDNNIVQEAFENVTTNLLTLLFYNTCNCLRDDHERENMLNPKYHTEGCPYKTHVENEAQIKFNDE